MFFQVFFGMGIPIFLCLVLARLYFSYHNLDMTESGYLKLELWISILFIAILNLYYCVYYLAFGDMGSIPAARKTYPDWTLRKEDEIIKAYEDEIALFYIENGVCFARLMNGDRYKVDRSIEMLMDELNKKEFFKINRSVIVNRRAIAGFKVESSNRLLLRFHINIRGYFFVSQRNVKDFKRWLG
jgi:DNA-binding LytR/AlgR family response regulator